MPTDLDTEVKNYLYGRERVPAGKRLVLCQNCGTFRPRSAVYDGTASSVLCEPCMRRMQENGGVAYLMCQSCGKFLGLYKVGKVDLESGVSVLVEPGDTLHTMWCLHCNPKEPSADIVEFRDIMLQKHLEAPKAPIANSDGKELKVEGL